MTMTQSDFVLLADGMRWARPESDASEDAKRQWEADLRAIIDAARAANPRFDRGRFVAAVNKPFSPTTTTYRKVNGQTIGRSAPAVDIVTADEIVGFVNPDGSGDGNWVRDSDEQITNPRYDAFYD